MRTCFCLLALFFLPCPGFAADAVPDEAKSPASKLPLLAPGQEWCLKWADDFDGKDIDASRWEVIGDSPRRDGFWTKSAVTLDGKGHLVLSTKREGDRYVSGAVRTLHKFEHAFGYWEARCKLPHRSATGRPSG